MHMFDASRVGKTHIAVCAVFAEVDPRRECDVNVLQELFGKRKAVVGIFRDVRPDVKRTLGFGVDLKKLRELGL